MLEQTLRRLREREGSARLTPASLPAALEELDAAMAERRAAAAGTRARAALRELEVDLRRLLRHEAETGPGLEPRWLEWSFGREGDEHGPLPLAGAGMGVTGRVDRIDVDAGGRALVRDYKGRTVERRRALGARPPAPGRALHARRARAARARDGRRALPAGRAPRRPRPRAGARRRARLAT